MSIFIHLFTDYTPKQSTELMSTIRNVTEWRKKLIKSSKSKEYMNTVANK